ncbi:MAG: hypothetical protein AAGC60_24275 [Acidobacteriota bacterium]
MKRLVPAPQWLVLVLALTVVALGVSGLAIHQPNTASPVVAAVTIPGPQCGPTYQWSCVIPGCPTCPEFYFVGTVCEKNEFEKQTGRVCSPI